MADRIDHATEAAQNLLVAAEFMQERQTSSASAVAQIASVQATLAMVEQQRIANLIALYDKDFPPLFLEPEEWADARAQIREALGL